MQLLKINGRMSQAKDKHKQSMNHRLLYSKPYILNMILSVQYNYGVYNPREYETKSLSNQPLVVADHL
jgi:hypothetical protein